MEYGKIIAITGMPGLFELLSSKNDGAIVRSLEDKSTKFVSSRVHNFSHLESIEVFTVKDNVNLSEIFTAMEMAGTDVPDVKDGEALKKYFLKISPDIDLERVYSSDLKKMVKWYEVLKENDIEIKLAEAPEETGEAAEAEEEVKPMAEPKARKTAAAKPEAEEKQKPVKTAKKKAESKEEETAAPKKAKSSAPKKELSAEPAKKTAKKSSPGKK